MVRALGGVEHASLDAALERLQPDIVMECTGAAAVIGALLGRTAPGGIICLLGVSAPGHDISVDMGKVNRARSRLAAILSIESADDFGPEHETRAAVGTGTTGWRRS